MYVNFIQRKRPAERFDFSQEYIQEIAMKVQTTLNNVFKDVVKLRGIDLLLALLFGYVVIAGVSIPPMFAELIDTLVGKAILIVLVLLLFMRSPIVGVLAMIAVFEVIRQAEHTTGTAQMRMFLPTDEHRGHFYTATNQYPVTIEEEVIAHMVPPVYEHPMHVASFKESSTDTYGASRV